jgi:HEAT repeat protein
MFNLPDVRIDRISFWLGFLAATLIWWLWGRIRPLLPQWRDQLKQAADKLRLKNFAGVEEYLRRETVHRAQRQHLAAPLFPLDDIIIQPRLIAPPVTQSPGEAAVSQTIASAVIPYLPEWPELVTPLGAPTMTPLHAIQSGRNIVIIGQPGSGKSVALAHLACQIARLDPGMDKLSGAVPLMVHALDLDTNLEDGTEPIQNLMRRIASQSSVVMQPQVQRYLKMILREKSRHIILLLDGLDELQPEQLEAAVTYLTALRKTHPRLQMVVTASADFMDGLTKIGFYPLGLASWSVDQRDALIQKWGELWTTQLIPDIKKQFEAKGIDPILFNYWLCGDPTYISPLEWTLRIWGAYAGDLSGSLPLGVLDTHISRFLPNAAYMPALEELAHEMLLKPGASMSFSEMEKILSAFNPQKPVENPAEQSTETAPLPEPEKKRVKTRRDISASQGEQIISALISGGILVEHANSQIRFANPVFLGFLAGMKITAEEADALLQKLDWTVAILALQYSTACSDSSAWIYPVLDDPVQPLFRDLLIGARWLRDAPANSEWRSFMMRALISLIQMESLPLGARARCIAAFLLSRDPATPKLFKQLFSSKSAVVRRLALMGAGALGNPQLIDDMIGLLADPVLEVRSTACLALVAIPGETSLNVLVNILLNGTEEARQAAAEGLALKGIEGQKLLEEAATVDDILTRRAAVFGLIQVQEPWARQALEKIAVEDGQWVVRNAAAQALETVQQSYITTPKLLPPPSESPWLLTFASKLGMGVLPGQPATDVLLQALKSGTIEEQISALLYLREQPDEGTVREIFNLVYSDQEELHEPALNALWWMSIGGFKLPSPQQFGLG